MDVVTFAGSLKLLMFFEGAKAEVFRTAICDIFRRQYAGDLKLMAEIEANSVSDAPLVQLAKDNIVSDQLQVMVVAMDDTHTKKRKLELEEQTMELALVERRQRVDLTACDIFDRTQLAFFAKLAHEQKMKFDAADHRQKMENGASIFVFESAEREKKSAQESAEREKKSAHESAEREKRLAFDMYSKSFVAMQTLAAAEGSIGKKCVEDLMGCLLKVASATLVPLVEQGIPVIQAVEIIDPALEVVQLAIAAPATEDVNAVVASRSLPVVVQSAIVKPATPSLDQSFMRATDITISKGFVFDKDQRIRLGTLTAKAYRKKYGSQATPLQKTFGMYMINVYPPCDYHLVLEAAHQL